MRQECELRKAHGIPQCQGGDGSRNHQRDGGSRPNRKMAGGAEQRVAYSAEQVPIDTNLWGQASEGSIRDSLTCFCGFALAFYHELDEVQLAQYWARHNERIEVLLAHAACQFVERADQFHPRIHERQHTFRIRVFRVVEIFRFEWLDLRFNVVAAQAEAERGVEAIHEVQIVRETFRPILPRVHRGVGADVLVAPVGRRAALVVAAQGGGA